MSDFEQVELDTDNGEVRMTRSDYAQVIFKNVSETYTIDKDVDVLYTVTRYFSPSKRDWIGLYKVGWTSSKSHLYYHWAIIPSGYQQGTEYEGKVTFAASSLPRDDGEFYQFCYVTSSGQVRGASTPFQFKHPSAEEFVEVMDNDNDIMIIKSKTSALEEQLSEVIKEKEQILKQKHHVEKEMESYLSKLMEIEKSLASEKQEKDAVRVDLQATQDKVASLHTEVKEKTARYQTLSKEYQNAKRENIRLETELSEAENMCQKLQAELKPLKNQVDELNGKNKSLQEEKDLYKEHFNASSDTLKERTLHVESLRKQCKRDEEDLQSLREAALQLEQELQSMKKQSDRQATLTEADKKHITDLRTQIQALNEQIEALNDCKLTLGQEVDTLMQAHDKMAKDMEASTSEAHSLKERLLRLEESKQRAQASMEGEVKFLQGKLDEKAEENAKLSAEHAKLTEALNKKQGDEGSMFALQLAHDELRKRLSKAEHHKNSLEKEITELLKRKNLWEVKEKEMLREIEDLKERLLMGQEEFKEKYIECKRLQQQLKKAARSSVSRSTSAEPSMATKTTETMRKSESEQTTQTSKAENERTTQTSKCENERTTQTSGVEKKDSEQMTSESAADLSSEEIQMQLAELGQELENRCAKKMKYKRLYQDEKEKSSYIQKHYHEQIEKKEREIDELRRKMREQEDQHLIYVRKMEEIESENIRQTAHIASLEKMLADKPHIRQPPKIPPRPSLDSGASSQPGGKHVTLCYGNTDGAKDMIEKVKNIASERSTQKGDSVTEIKERQNGTVEDDILQNFDPLQNEAEGRVNDNEPSCVFEPRSHKQGKGDKLGSTVDDSVSASEPAPIVKSRDTGCGPVIDEEPLSAEAGAGASGPASVVVKRPPNTPAPATQLSANGHRNAVDGGSTEYRTETIDERGSAIREPAAEQIERDAHCDVTGSAPSAPRDQEAEEEKYFDAPPAPAPVCPSCPVCNLVFPPNTDATILNAHANTHFSSITDSQPQRAPEPPRKKCPMCTETYPDDKQREFEDHVQAHFDADPDMYA